MNTSTSVGTSGSAGMRCALVTASARTLPPCTCGIAVDAIGNANCVAPAMMDGTISTEPLYGTCTTSIPACIAIAAAHRCAALPTPPEA